MATVHTLAIDPGLKTGVAFTERIDDGDPHLLDSAELDEDEFAPYIRAVMDDHPDVVIVCERFIINAQTAKKSQAPFSLELIGVLKQILRDAGRPVSDVNFQAPADAMSMFTNPKLKKLGYWHTGGAGHALDAIRHVLLRAAKTGWFPKKLLD